MSQYRYAPLQSDDIRLLRLHPGAVDDPLVFTIFHSHLLPPKARKQASRLAIDDLQRTLPEDWLVKETIEGRYLFMRLGTSGTPNSWRHPDPSHATGAYNMPSNETDETFEPRYEALSYTWGSGTDPNAATVVEPAGQPGPHRTMSIGPSLSQALKHIRYSDKSRTLWVDAICINQDDIDERNAQVKRMGNIYSLASNVVIWLGPEEHGSTQALSSLAYFGEQVEFTLDECIGDAPGAQEPKWWNAEVALPYDDETWERLTRLFRRSWFDRVWVLQEALLARTATVQCGSCTISWSLLRKAMIVLAEKVGLPAELFESLGSYRTALVGPLSWSLPRLLHWGRFRQCTDPRDKVYGILSLLSTPLSSNLKVDYKSPIEQVYLDTTIAHIMHVNRLSLLRDCQIKSRIRDCPSWVPNWAPREATFFGFRKGHTRQASGYSACQVTFPTPHVLEVLGTECGKVSGIHKIPSGNIDEAFKAIRMSEPEGLFQKDYFGGSSLLEAFLEVIAKGRIRDRFPNIPPFPTLKDLRSGYQECVAGKATMHDVLQYFKEEMKTDETWMFSTEDGYLGASQSEPHKGDMVCVILGCDYPLLLRYSPPEGFLVIGQCFVHGVMDGEQLLGQLTKPWKMHMLADSDGREVPCYVNEDTQTVTRNDPRLPALNSEWELVRRKRRQDDPTFFRDFRNKRTGNTVNYDPRMTPEALTERGCQLKSFRLI